MKIRINEVPEQEDVEVIINCKKVDEEIMRIITMLRVYDKKLTGIKGDQTYLLDAAKIFYIDTVDKKTFLYTEN